MKAYQEHCNDGYYQSHRLRNGGVRSSARAAVGRVAEVSAPLAVLCRADHAADWIVGQRVVRAGDFPPDDVAFTSAGPCRFRDSRIRTGTRVAGGEECLAEVAAPGVVVVVW
jgi:hypothetical protein